jgi:hypothetical protein
LSLFTLACWCCKRYSTPCHLLFSLLDSSVSLLPSWRLSFCTCPQLCCSLSLQLLQTALRNRYMSTFIREPSTIHQSSNMDPSSDWEHQHKTRVCGHRYNKTTYRLHRAITAKTQPLRNAIQIQEASSTTGTQLGMPQYSYSALTCQLTSRVVS